MSFAKFWVGIEKMNSQLRSPINSAGNCKLPASSIQRNVPEQRWQRDVLQQNEEVFIDKYTNEDEDEGDEGDDDDKSTSQSILAESTPQEQVP